MKRPKLIPGRESSQFFRTPEHAHARMHQYPLTMCTLLAEDMAKRINESRKLFKWKFFRGDCHSHTQHSDGCGTVAQTAEMVKAAGLDFQFVTDHWGVTQAPECRKHGLWFGQEPTTKYHHMGILGLNYAFEPQQDFLADMAAAKKAGAVVFVPHPTGWWPKTIYNDEQEQILEQLPDPFLMEISNGANNIVNAFDITDESAIELWDHLLMLGKTVHAMGNTDAHAPHGIGIVWNSVFATKCDQKTILKALCAGRSFVSDGALVHIQMGRTTMGRKASEADRKQTLNITAADSRGLAMVRLIGDGKQIGRWDCKDEPKWTRSHKVPKRIKRYVRVEVRSLDGRRAYSNPIYLS